MKHQADAFERVVAAGFDAWRVSLTIAETMAASQAVIGARLTMMGSPGRFPFAEVGRLLPEKARAFSKAQAGAARAIPSGPVGMLDWWESSIRATAAWWAPVHAQVVANAKRLT